MREIAMAEGLTERFIAQQMQLALLAPTLIEGILDGQIYLDTTAKRLTQPPRFFLKLSFSS